MPTFDVTAARARLHAMGPALDEGEVEGVLRELVRDGSLSAAEKALLDEHRTAMEPAARARYDAFLGVSQVATAPTPAPARSLASDPVFADVAAGRALLREGSRGPAVRALQETLIELGFGSWSPTDYFGPRTKQALMELQVAYNNQLVAPMVARSSGSLAVDGVLGRNTLTALDQALAGAASGVRAKVGGAVDQADLVIDLRKQVAYLSVAHVDKAKLDGLLASLESEATARSSAAYTTLRATIAPDGVVRDDFEVKPLKSEGELGLADSDGEARAFLAFPVAVGERARTASGYLTPTGSFVIGDKRKNREGSQWGHPNGFATDPQNPFGPRWLRLYRETANGGKSHTAYGLHGTTATATWMKREDGERAVSHGCVRFENHDIIKLFEYLPNGARVRIVNALPDEPPAASSTLPPNA